MGVPDPPSPLKDSIGSKDNIHENRLEHCRIVLGNVCFMAPNFWELAFLLKKNKLGVVDSWGG